MKKYLCTVLALLCVISNTCVYDVLAAQDGKSSDAGTPKVTETKKDDSGYSPLSTYMFMVDMDSGLTLYEKNSDKLFDPDGFVKILTAITAIEKAEDLSAQITVEPGILEGYNYDLGNIGLKYGEVMSVQNMLEGLLIYDAGDCAIALAHGICDSYDEFIDEMNSTAQKAGAQNSTFVNPTGSIDSNQKTTLEDLYLITKYAMSNETFAKLVKTERVVIGPTNKYTDSRILFNKNNFITTYHTQNHYNANIEGVKAYNNPSGSCGVIAKYKNSKNNLLIICADSVYKDGNSFSYDDAKYLIEYANLNFNAHTLIAKDEIVSEVQVLNGKNGDRVLLISDGYIKAKLPKDYASEDLERNFNVSKKINAPVKKGSIIGTASVSYKGQVCGEVNLIAYSSVELSIPRLIKNKIMAVLGSIYFKLIFTGLIAVFIIRTIYINKKKKRKSKK